MNDRLERFFEFEVRAENNNDHGDFLVGRPIVFSRGTDIGGWYQEIIEPGALDKTDLRDVRFLVGHDRSMIPLARSRRNNANSTMQMEVDEAGMNIRVDLDTENNSTARALYSATSRGDISGMSFAFTVDGEEWTDLESEYPTRHIRSIGRVYEVSAVSFPAYEQTTLEARCAEELESARALLESRRQEEKDQTVREEIRKMLEVRDEH